MIGLGLSAWVLIPTFNQARTPGVEAQNWIIPGVAGLAIAVLTVVAAWTTLRRMQRRVECVTGSVRLLNGRPGRAGTADRLEVAGRAFPLPQSALAASGVIPAYQAILTDGAYHVYVQGLRLLAIEPVWVSVLDRAAAGGAGSVAVVGTARPRRLRMTWFLKACFVLVLLGTLGIGAGGVYLTVIQFTGVPATATVTECVEDTSSRYPGVTYDCTGTWVSGGALVGGHGHVIVGTVDGADNTDVGKTLGCQVGGRRGVRAVTAAAAPAYGTWIRVGGSHRVCARAGTKEARTLDGSGPLMDGSAALSHLGDLVGDQTVRLAVHGRCGLLGGCLDQAEDGTASLVEPVLQVVDPMLRLHFEISLVRACDCVSSESVDFVMLVHVERHDVFSLQCSSDRGEPITAQCVGY